MLLPRTQSSLLRIIFFFRSCADLVLWRLQNFDWKITASPLELWFQRNVDTHQISKVSDYEMARSKLGKGFGPTEHLISRKTLSSSSKGLFCLKCRSFTFCVLPSCPVGKYFWGHLWNRPAQLAELSHSKFDPELFSHCAYVNFLWHSRQKCRI